MFVVLHFYVRESIIFRYYLSLVKEEIALCSTWWYVAECPSDGSSDVCVAVVHQLGQSEIWETGFKVLIQQHICGADIPMNNTGFTAMMNVRESPGHSQCYVNSGLPVHRVLLLRLGTRCKPPEASQERMTEQRVVIWSTNTRCACNDNYLSKKQILRDEDHHLRCKSWSNIPFGRKSYTRSFVEGEMQYPRSLTRLQCLISPSVSNSFSKPRVASKHCFSFFTAKVLLSLRTIL